MARLLVQLKLRLLRNALRASAGARAAFIASSVLAVLVAAGVFTLLASLHGNDAAVDLSAVIFTIFAFAWLILPLVVFGLDSTLDPATLALYPLRTRPLAAGLLAASATGPWPAATLIGLLGVTVGLASGAGGIITAVVAVLLQVLFCIVLARLVTTGLAGMLRSRRGKDFAALAIIPIFALYEIFVQLVPKLTAEGKLTAASFAGVDAWLRWLPPGLAAHAIQDASDGRAGVAALRLLLLAGIIVVLAAAWIRSLGRALVTADASTQAAAVHGTGLPLARSGLRGTVAARSWVYQRREPSSLITWGVVVVVMGASSASTITTENYQTGLFIAAVVGSAFTGVYRTNAIGQTGPGFGLEAMALSDRSSWRAYFSGLDLATAAVALPLLIAVSFVLAVVARHPADGVSAVVVELAGVGAGLALGNFFSAALPYPMERRPGNPTPRAASGYTGHTLLATFGSLIGVGVLVAPVIVAWELTKSAPAGARLPVLLVGAAAYGLLLAWAGLRIAARLSAQTLPELYQVAVRSKL